MDNVFCFWGADHKVGTSMISQCIAEVLHKKYGASVLLIHTQNRSDCEYSPNVHESVDNIRSYLINNIPDADDILSRARLDDGMYIISGPSRLGEWDTYHPDMCIKLLECLRSRVDCILCDCGSEIEHGLSLGALLSAGEVFVITEQKEYAFRRFEYMTSLFGKLNIKTGSLILNKFDKASAYTEKYALLRFGKIFERVFTIRRSGNSENADMESKSLLNYKDPGLERDVNAAALYITSRYSENE